MDALSADGVEMAGAHLPGNGNRGSESRLFSKPRSPVPGWAVSAHGGGWVESCDEAVDGLSLLRDTRVLIVDDCTLYRDYLAGVLASPGGAAAPAVAWDLPSLIASFDATLPRIILMNMATRDSAVLLRQALNLSPHTRVVVMGVSEDDESEIVACAEAGVAGYHLRTDSLDDLLVLIHKVAAGESICSPRVSAILLRRLSALASQRQPAAKELVLTAREIQILRMLELGLANREIADELCIAIHTVKNHVHSLLTKLDVSTRAQAAAVARTILPAADLPEN
ncbi:LuxR C-terminal-related transcriptional regulator [Mycobacterium sp. NPDC003449]